jgi:hypothetical protein
MNVPSEYAASKMKEIKKMIVTITFDGEIYIASIDGQEVGADRSRGQLIVRMFRKYGKAIKIEG